MSNHLQDLIEADLARMTCVRDDSHISLDEDLAIDDLFKRISKNAMCFFAGEFEAVAGLSSCSELCRLPFEHCWIEFSTTTAGLLGLDAKRASKQVVIGALCTENAVDAGYVAQVWVKNVEAIWVYQFTYHSDGSKSKINNHGSVNESIFYQSIIHTINAFLSALNCTNINRIEHKPSEKLQKARAKRGKKPLFSYWTLEIDLQRSREVGEDCGGTHASPRLHLRRQHPREYAPGKWCWVHAHAVGNKKLGMVHKDYTVKH